MARHNSGDATPNRTDGRDPIEVEADKIEGLIRSGHPEQATNRLREDAELLGEDSMNRLAKRVDSKNQEDKDSGLYPGMADVDLGYAYGGLAQIVDGKVDGVTVSGQARIDTNEERQHPENATSGFNIIDKQEEYQQQPDSVVTSDVNDKFNPNNYYCDRPGHPLTVSMPQPYPLAPKEYLILKNANNVPQGLTPELIDITVNGVPQRVMAVEKPHR